MLNNALLVFHVENLRKEEIRKSNTVFTVWDEAIQQCVPDVISAACYYDVNGSGMVDTQDLIEFLAAFGQACE